jgi:hypothetical protein
MQPEIIHSTTKQRHRIIWDIYETYLKELGNKARDMSRKSIYNEVAKRSNYSNNTVKRVIFSIMRGGENGNDY